MNSCVFIFTDNEHAAIHLLKYELSHNIKKNSEVEQNAFILDDDILLLACENKMSNLAHLLLDNKLGNVAIVASSGNAFWHACNNNLEESLILKLMRSSGTDLGIVYNESTPLIKLCKNLKSKTAIELILTGKANQEFACDNSGTALSWAIYNKMKSVAHELLLTGNCSLNHIHSKGETALSYARKEGEYMADIAQTIISMKPDDVTKGNALYFACINGNESLVLSLLNAAEPFMWNNFNNFISSIHAACKRGIENACHVMLDILFDKSKLSFSAGEKVGCNLLHVACKYKMNSVAVRVITMGKIFINFNSKNIGGNTALNLACKNNMLDVINALLGIDNIQVGLADNNGYTPLMWACINVLPDVASDLIYKNENNLLQVNNDNKTALIYACLSNMDDVSELILKKGGDIMFQNILGESYAQLLAKINVLPKVSGLLSEYVSACDIRKTKNMEIKKCHKCSCTDC